MPPARVGDVAFFPAETPDLEPGHTNVWVLEYTSLAKAKQACALRVGVFASHDYMVE